MDQFFNWLSKPMEPEDVNAWFMANNIVPEMSDLFRDFCFSFIGLMRTTYLGDSHGEFKETKIGLDSDDKKTHFQWCWDKTIKNFEKENIFFNFDEESIEYFESFFFEVFYNQPDEEVRNELESFFYQLFNRRRPMSKSDIEMFTDVYKILEKSLKN
jgi:hypothetical protein